MSTNVPSNIIPAAIARQPTVRVASLLPIAKGSLRALVDTGLVPVSMLKDAYPDAFFDGELAGPGKLPPGPRERGGYPMAFHQGPLGRRNAWFAGFNVGCIELRRS
jgi:hypothetical protein